MHGVSRARLAACAIRRQVLVVSGRGVSSEFRKEENVFEDAACERCNMLCVVGVVVLSIASEREADATNFLYALTVWGTGT